MAWHIIALASCVYTSNKGGRGKHLQPAALKCINYFQFKRTGEVGAPLPVPQQKLQWSPETAFQTRMGIVVRHYPSCRFLEIENVVTLGSKLSRTACPSCTSAPPRERVCGWTRVLTTFVLHPMK